MSKAATVPVSLLIDVLLLENERQCAHLSAFARLSLPQLLSQTTLPHASFLPSPLLLIWHQIPRPRRERAGAGDLNTAPSQVTSVCGVHSHVGVSRIRLDMVNSLIDLVIAVAKIMALQVVAAVRADAVPAAVTFHGVPLDHHGIAGLMLPVASRHRQCRIQPIG